MSDYLETVELMVDARKSRLSALTDANKHLEDMSRLITTINNQLAGLSQPVVFKKTAADIGAMIDRAQRLGRFGKGGAPSLNPKEMAKALGYDPKAVESFINQSMLGGKSKVQQTLRRQMDALYSAASGEFRSLGKAQQALALFTKRFDPKQNPLNTLGNLFGGSGGGGTGAGAALKGAATGGPINLVIPPSQIVATLGPGVVNVTLPAAQVAGVGGGGKTAAALGGAAAVSGPLNPASGIVTQIRTELPSGKKRVRTVSGATTTDTTGEKQVVTEDLKGKAREGLLTKLEQVERAYNKAVADVLKQPAKTRNLSDITAAGKKAGEQAKALAYRPEFEALDLRSRKSIAQKFSTRVEKQSGTTADGLQREMAESFARVGALRQQLQKARDASDKAMVDRIKKEVRAEEQRQREIGRMNQSRDRAQEKTDAAKRKTAEFLKQQADDAIRIATSSRNADAVIADMRAKGAKITESVAQEVGRNGQIYNRRKVTAQLDENGTRRRVTATYSGNRARLEENTGATPAGQQSWLARGTQGFTPGGFAKNLLSIGAWSTAVAALYAPIRLVNYALAQMMEIGLQTARLSQTFRGVGGSARDLRDDVMQLASATGQMTEDAMQSAVAWSRLGLSRKQDAEAVRVSLMAANVAEMSAAQSTEHLAAVTQVYKLRVSELEGVLGMFNQTSNTARVRNADLLEGLANVAAVGKEAGFSLAELQGIIGGGVEISGNTGNRMSNALKNVLTRLGRPDVQDYLQRSAGVETKRPDGSEKSRAEILRELFISYQKLNETERTNLAGRVAGAHQANRFAAIMDSYLRGQQLAIDAQLHLNSAQQENAKIIATLKSQLAGLRAETDRFAVGSGLDEYLAELVRGAKNLMRELNGLQLPDWMKNLGPISQFRRGQQDAAAFTQANPQAGKARQYAFLMQDYAMNLMRGRIELPYGRMAGLLQNRNETPFEQGNEAFRNQLQQLRAKASSQQDESRLFDTVRRVLQTGTPENVNQAGKFMNDFLRGRNAPESSAFTQALASGDLVRQQEILATAKQRASEAGLDADREALTVQQQRVAEGQAQARALSDTITQLETAGGDTDKLSKARNDLAEINEELRDLDESSRAAIGKYADSLEEVANADQSVKELRQESLSLLQRQEDVMQSIASLYAQLKPPTAVGQLDFSAKMLREQIAMLEESQNDPLNKFLSEAQSKAQDEKLKQLRAQLDSATNPDTRRWVGRLDEFRLGQEQARRDVRPFSVGTDETQALLNEQAALRAQIAALRKKESSQGLTPGGQEPGRLIELENQLEESKKRILDRQAEVHREINQLLVDRNKEIQRSFFGAGPEELLRKLAAFRMSFDDRGRKKPDQSLGGFFAMNPNLRGDYGMFNPNFDPTMSALFRERNRYKATGDGAPVPVTVVGNTNTGTTGGTRPATGSTADAGLEVFAAAREVMDKFTGSVGRATTALDTLTASLTATATATEAAPVRTGGGGQFGGVGGANGHVR